jgi:hypothetical protein
MFAEMIDRFRKECGAHDMIALDAFFYTFWDSRLGRR